MVSLSAVLFYPILIGSAYSHSLPVEKILTTNFNEVTDLSDEDYVYFTQFDLDVVGNTRSVSIYVPQFARLRILKYENVIANGENSPPVEMVGPGQVDRTDNRIFETLSLYDNGKVLFVDVADETQFKISSVGSSELSLFSGHKMSRNIYSYYVDDDKSVIVADTRGLGMNRVVRLVQDSHENVQVLSFLIGVESISRISPGHTPTRPPSFISPDFVLRYYDLRMEGSQCPAGIFACIKLRNISDQSEIDLVELFGAVVPRQCRPIDSSFPVAEGDRVFDVNFDRSFTNYKVAVVTYVRPPSIGNDRAIFYYVVYVATREFPDQWNFAGSFNLPNDEGFYGEPVSDFNNYRMPLALSPVFRKGVFIVAMLNKINRTLSFFKVDILSSVDFFHDPRVIHFAAGMSKLNTDSPIRGAMGAVAQNVVDRHGAADNRLQEIHNKSQDPGLLTLRSQESFTPSKPATPKSDQK